MMSAKHLGSVLLKTEPFVAHQCEDHMRTETSSRQQPFFCHSQSEESERERERSRTLGGDLSGAKKQTRG